MDLWDISKDVFDSLIQDVSAKAAEDDEDPELRARNILRVLPPELLQQIFGILPRSDLLAVRMVCKEFNEAASNPQVLKLELLENYFDSKEFELEVVQPLLRNIKSVNVYSISDEQPEEAAKLFKTLEEKCTNLKALKIGYGCIPASISLENIAEKLTELSIMSIDFKDAPRFFQTSPEKSVYRNLKKFEMQSCTGFGDEAPFQHMSVAPMRNLQDLKFCDVQGLGDRDFAHLKESMTNLTSLSLANTTLNVEMFEQMNMRKLTGLYLTQCQCSDDWLSAVKNLTELDSLYLSEVGIKDTCSAVTFKKLNALTTIYMFNCDFGNRTVAALGAYLPRLMSWQMMPNEDGNITDTAFHNLEVHPHLQLISFDRVQLGGFSLRQIARCSPVIRELTLTICTAGNDDMDVFKEYFTELTKLSITGLRITDVGLAKLEPRLGKLEDITISSRSMTAAGVSWMLPKLTSANCIDVKFGEQESSLSSSRCADDTYNQLSFCGPGITRELLMSLHLKNTNILRFDTVTLTVEEMKWFAETQPKIDNLSIRLCSLDEEATAVIFRLFANLTILSLDQCHLTVNAMLRLFEGIGFRPINQIVIENETMLDETALLAVVPMLFTVTDLNIHTLDYAQLLAMNNYAEYKDLTVQGMPQVGDDVIVNVMKLYSEVTNLTIVDTNVTPVGIAEMAEPLTKLAYLRIKSTLMGDDTMEIIGRHFPSLKTLTFESERVTDAGLVALGKHLETLENLSVIHSGITDEGVKQIAPLLKSITTLDVYSGNKNVTSELLTYMRETYPDVAHTEPEVEEAEEAEEGNGEAPAAEGQPEGQNVGEENGVAQPEGGGNGVAAEPGQNGDARELRPPEGQNDVAAEPARQEEAENEEDVGSGQQEVENRVAEQNGVHVEAEPPEERQNGAAAVAEPVQQEGNVELQSPPGVQNMAPEEPEVELQPAAGHNGVDVELEQPGGHNRQNGENGQINRKEVDVNDKEIVESC